MLMLGLLNLVNSFEDALLGLYHNLGRLDNTGKYMTAKFVLRILIMTVGLMGTHIL